MEEEPEVTDFEIVFETSKTGFLLDEIECLPEEAHILKTLVNDSNYVGRKLSTNVEVPANIHKPQYREFWCNILKPSNYVLDIIKFGYKLPFASEPPQSFSENNRSAREDTDFVRAEIFRLESLGCIERVSCKPFIILPLSSIYSKKKRLVVDASRGLNPYLKDRRVRLQDHRDIATYVNQGDVFTVDDLDSGYWLE